MSCRGKKHPRAHEPRQGSGLRQGRASGTRGRMAFMWTTMPSPVGDLRIVASDGAIRALYFLAAGEASSDDVAERYLARAESKDIGERRDADPLLRDAV